MAFTVSAALVGVRIGRGHLAGCVVVRAYLLAQCLHAAGYGAAQRLDVFFVAAVVARAPSFAQQAAAAAGAAAATGAA